MSATVCGLTAQQAAPPVPDIAPYAREENTPQTPQTPQTAGQVTDYPAGFSFGRYSLNPADPASLRVMRVMRVITAGFTVGLSTLSFRRSSCESRGLRGLRGYFPGLYTRAKGRADADRAGARPGTHAQVSVAESRTNRKRREPRPQTRARRQLPIKELIL